MFEQRSIHASHSTLPGLTCQQSYHQGVSGISHERGPFKEKKRKIRQAKRKSSAAISKSNLWPTFICVQSFARPACAGMSPENKHTHTYTLSSTEKCIHGQSATIRLKLISSLGMYATQRTRPTTKGGRIYCASTLAYKWHRGCKGQGRNQRCVDSGKSPRCCTKKFKRVIT